MKKTIYLPFVILCLVLSTPAFAAGQLGDDVVPRSETIRLKIDPAATDYSGVATFVLDVRRPSSSFRLHAQEMTIDDLTIFDDTTRRDVTWSFDDAGLLNVRTKSPLEPGAATMTIRFRNDLGTRAVGLYKTVFQNSPYAFTFFEPNHARQAFPSFDEPRFKIPFQISVQVPERYTVVSNTPVATTTSSEGWNVTSFEPTKPLPSYLLQVSVGELESVPIPGLRVPGNIVVPKGTTGMAKIAAEQTGPIVDALEQWFGMQYPYEKIDLIAVPEFWAGAMEQPGAVTFADRVILLDPDSASANQRSTLGMVIAHELAHMWFGDLVTMKWWDDLWLNESFAEWMGNRIANEVFPQYQRDLEAMWATQSVMARDARPSTPKVRQPVENADEALATVGIAYEKGEAILRMFEGWLGEETFRAGVRHYLETHAWSNAEASDLWNSLSEVSNRDVGTPMRSFIEQTGFPLIHIESDGKGTLSVSQERFHNAGVDVDPESWIVPIQIREPEGHVSSFLLEETSATTSSTLESPRWIFPNAGGAAYYRWTTSPEQLRSLTAAAGDVLSPAERISLLGNLSSLLDGGQITGDLYLDSLLQFADDPAPQVITGLVNLAGGLDLPLVAPDLKDEYALYIRDLLKPALARYGVQPREGEPEVVSLVRPRLWALLGDEGHDQDVTAAASDLAERFAADPASVNPSLAGVAVLLSVQDGSETQFEDVVQRFKSAKSPSERAIWLSAIGGFRRPDLQRKALEIALSDEVRPPDVFRIVGGMLTTPAGSDLVWNWLRENFAAVASRFPRPYIGFMPAFAEGCSTDRLAEAREFFADEAHRAEGTDARMAETAEAVTDCVNLREREMTSVSNYLRALE